MNYKFYNSEKTEFYYSKISFENLILNEELIDFFKRINIVI